MWKFIRSFFGSREVNSQPLFDFETIKSEVENILRLDFESEAAREANSELVLNVLRRLDSEIENVTARQY